MMNPDGVIVGNYRTSLAGVDLNRVYKKPVEVSWAYTVQVSSIVHAAVTLSAGHTVSSLPEKHNALGCPGIPHCQICECPFKVQVWVQNSDYGLGPRLEEMHAGQALVLECDHVKLNSCIGIVSHGVPHKEDDCRLHARERGRNSMCLICM